MICQVRIQSWCLINLRSSFKNPMCSVGLKDRRSWPSYISSTARLKMSFAAYLDYPQQEIEKFCAGRKPFSTSFGSTEPNVSFEILSLLLGTWRSSMMRRKPHVLVGWTKPFTNAVTCYPQRRDVQCFWMDYIPPFGHWLPDTRSEIEW